MSRSVKLVRRVGICIGIVLLIVALSIYLVTTSSMPSHNKQESSGLAYGLALGYTLPSMSHKARVQELKDIKAIGFTEVRYNIPWNVVQPSSDGNFTWAAIDPVMQDVKNSGLASVVTLDRTPSWAAVPSCKYSLFCAPANPSNFAKFAAAAVNRYKNYHVNAWEIWNEQNIANFWKPAPSPEQYTQMLKDTYIAVKQQDRSAIVLVGGLAGDAADNTGPYLDPRVFLTGIYASQGKGYFDGVAYHPYTELHLPNIVDSHNGWPKLYSQSPSIRSIMIQHGDSKKDVWITEMGAPTNGPELEATASSLNTSLYQGTDHVSPQAQAEIAEQVISDIKSMKLTWIKDFDWFTYKDGETTPVEAGGFYGIEAENGAPKPIVHYFKSLLKR